MRLSRLLSITILTLIALSGCQSDPVYTAKALAISESHYKALSPEKQKRYTSTYRSNLNKRQSEQMRSYTKNHSTISVDLQGGKAKMHPHYLAETYKAQPVSVPANRCKTMTLTSQNNPSHTGSLLLCYLSDKLYIDASSIDENYPTGSVIIPIHSQVAGRLQFCQLNTKGNAHLLNACLTVTLPDADTSLPVEKLTAAPKNKGFKPALRDPSDSLIQYD